MGLRVQTRPWVSWCLTRPPPASPPRRLPGLSLFALLPRLVSEPARSLCLLLTPARSLAVSHSCPCLSSMPHRPTPGPTQASPLRLRELSPRGLCLPSRSSFKQALEALPQLSSGADKKYVDAREQCSGAGGVVPGEAARARRVRRRVASRGPEEDGRSTQGPSGGAGEGAWARQGAKTPVRGAALAGQALRALFPRAFPCVDPVCDRCPHPQKCSCLGPRWGVQAEPGIVLGVALARPQPAPS